MRRPDCRNKPNGIAASSMSARRAAILSLAAAITGFAGVGCQTTRNLEPIRAITLNTRRPPAVPGGVLMIPLTAGNDLAGWPKTMTLSAGNDTRITGRVAWVEAEPADRIERHWTDPRQHWRVRPIRRDDPLGGSAGQRGGAMLLAHLGYEDAGADVRSAVARSLDEGPRTPDLGGSATTEDVTEAVLRRL